MDQRRPTHDTVTDDASEALLTFARAQGVNEALVIATERLSIKDRFRELCQEPYQCPSFGTSIHCPPHCETPAEFRERLRASRFALVFRLDVPVEATVGESRREVGRLLQDITADIEGRARELGFGEAAGFSSGGCKETYCGEHATCAALEGAGCRFPDRARTSLSGLGFDAQHLLREVGWLAGDKALEAPTAGSGPVMMLGLVLLG